MVKSEQEGRIKDINDETYIACGLLTPTKWCKFVKHNTTLPENLFLGLISTKSTVYSLNFSEDQMLDQFPLDSSLIYFFIVSFGLLIVKLQKVSPFWNQYNFRLNPNKEQPHRDQ